jgi:hypothetical protein
MQYRESVQRVNTGNQYRESIQRVSTENLIF